MLQSVSSVFVVYRCKTLTGSPDPTHANGMDKPCSRMHTTTAVTIGGRCTCQRCTCQGVYLPWVVYLPGGVPSRGVPARGCTCPGEVHLPGCTFQGVYLPGGVPTQGRCTCLGVYLTRQVYLPGGCTYPGGCTCPGAYLPRGCTCQGLSQHALRQTAPREWND